MTTANDFSGNYRLSPDFPVGYGALISDPATQLSDMKSKNLYYAEIFDQDTLLVNVEDYLLSGFKTLSFQKLMAQWVFRMTLVGTEKRVVCIHRNLSIVTDLQTAFRSVGENVSIPNSFTDMVALNQALAPLYCQLWIA